MTRARATDLVLVNWKGVFYERYRLDRHVTALEGANGAGKTTVMIASYVVLLPDLSRLRFTNLGETGATSGDKGIWGRLGDAARPSYAALSIDVGDGTHVIAGVHLERKAEPSLVLSPFLITGVSSGLPLQQMFLASREDDDVVPTLDEFKTQVSRAGAHLQLCPSLKEYTQTLFELGIAPLRLSTDEEKTKFNDMLRTSMTGGISRALTSELRDFLLKREPGLADVLARMRGNLDACRRTRIEVVEARQLEQEISFVFDVGQGMFASALLGQRALAQERAQLLLIRRNELDRCVRDAASLEREAEDARSLAASMGTRHSGQKERVAGCEELVERIARVKTLREHVAELDAQTRGASSSVVETEALRAVSERERRVCKEETERAREAVSASARGLANLQTGLSELHRRAHAHRLFIESRARLCTLMGLADASFEELVERRGEFENLREQLDQQCAFRARQVRSPKERREAFERIGSALNELEATLGIEDPSGTLAHRFDGALACRRGLEKSSSEAPHLRNELKRLRASAERQTEAREAVRNLGLDSVPRTGEEFLEARHTLALRKRELQKQREDLDGVLREAELSESRALQEISVLEERARTWPAIEAAQKRLTEVHGSFDRSREGLLALRRELESNRTEALAESQSAEERRDQVLSLAQELERTGTVQSAELSRLRDVLEGELLTARYEDVSFRAAQAIEARLGPLKDALVVPDLALATKRLHGELTGASSVWLVEAGADVAVDEGPVHEGTLEVVVKTETGARITRLPKQSVLGRAARERQKKELLHEADELDRAIEESRTRLPRLMASLADVEVLQDHFHHFRLGDPAAQLQSQRENVQSLAQRLETGRQRFAELNAEMSELASTMQRIDALGALVHLLDPPDYEVEEAETSLRLEQAERALELLERTRETTELLLRQRDSLATPPPTDEEIDSWEREGTAIDAERDRLFQISEALFAMESRAHARDWTDAERGLDESVSLVPELEAQHEFALAALKAAEERALAVEQSWESAVQATQSASAAHQVIRATWERAKSELAADTELDVSEDAAREASTALDAARAELERGTSLERESATQVALLEERQRVQSERIAEVRKSLQTIEEQAQPATQKWTALEDRARTKGVLDSALSHFGADAPLRTSVDWWAEARSKRDLLLDRLRAVPAGRDVAERLAESLAVDPARFAEAVLDGWLHVRDYLSKRLPAPVAQLGEPALVLRKLRDDLTLLEHRLKRQETDLVGSSEDVARGIEVQMRRATSQVRRLNQVLEGIRFGSIHGIRVRIARIEKMAQILAALRDGRAQELLFHSKLPIEAALDEIFRRYGSGRTGGQRLLDYREYLELGVEVKRQVDQGWEPANPTRVSTGEAIGVGAALMMVILTEWERDANLLRKKRGHGSLRFLFLDEANRLSQDNLAVLFDLCRTLDLQLLIAAPEVARAEGNTTYRLVRRVTEEGEEEVLVTGRRVAESMESLPVEPDAAVEPAMPPLGSQSELF